MVSSPHPKMPGAIGAMSREPVSEFDQLLTQVMPWPMPSSGSSPVVKVMVLQIRARLAMMPTVDIVMLFSLPLRLALGSR